MLESFGDRVERVRLRNVMDAVQDVFATHVERGLPTPPFVVLLGGSAMAAHEIREQSEDVYFFATQFDADVVMEVEARLKLRYGNLFKIDATAAENIRGQIIIRDIASSPDISKLDIGGRSLVVKALTPEDLYLLKLYAGREKDRVDLELLKPRVDFDKLTTRFGDYLGWHPDPHHLIGYVDQFVQDAGSRWGQDELALIDRLVVSKFVKEALREDESHMTDPAARVAHDMAEDGRCLGQIVDLISSRCPWQDWPEQSRADVLSACDARGLNPAERVKADTLRWHLFRRHDVSQPGQEVPAAHRVVERVRSDLIGLVRLGSGRYLLGDIPGCGPDLEEVVPPTRPRSPDTPNCMPTRV